MSHNHVQLNTAQHSIPPLPLHPVLCWASTQHSPCILWWGWCSTQDTSSYSAHSQRPSFITISQGSAEMVVRSGGGGPWGMLRSANIYHNKKRNIITTFCNQDTNAKKKKHTCLPLKCSLYTQRCIEAHIPDYHLTIVFCTLEKGHRPKHCVFCYAVAITSLAYMVQSSLTIVSHQTDREADSDTHTLYSGPPPSLTCSLISLRSHQWKQLPFPCPSPSLPFPFFPPPYFFFGSCDHERANKPHTAGALLEMRELGYYCMDAASIGQLTIFLRLQARVSKYIHTLAQFVIVCCYHSDGPHP